MLKKIILIYFFLGSLFGNFNSFGKLGYIHTPSAYNLEEGIYLFNFSRNVPERRISLTASPFNWLDASLFYVDIAGKEYGGNFKQSYKDKGFSFKLSPAKIFDHEVAIGFNDLAGTGLFSSEYVVLSKTINKFEYSIGIGWGAFNNGIVISNPLSNLDESFISRTALTKDRGGNFDIDKYFSGEKASFFFGGSYRFNSELSFIFERDPTDTSDIRIPYSRKSTNYNFAVNYLYKDFLLKYSLQRGKDFGIQISYANDAKKHNPFLNKEPANKIRTFEDLQNHLASLQIGLKSISEEKERIQVSVRQVIHHDHSIVDRVVVKNISNMAEEHKYKEVIVKQYYQGMNVSTSSYDIDNSYALTNKKFTQNKDLYVIKEQFPYIYNNLYPSIRNFIAGREGFYFGGLLLNNDTEIIPKENLIFLLNLKYSLWDNFSNLIYPPIDTYPAQVRSDIKEYYKGLSNNISVGRLEMNYFYSPLKHHYIRASAGIFEEMFGGFGLDYVFSPENSIFSFGYEAYHVKKREYDMDFSFQDYANNFTRVSIQILEPKTNIRFKLSRGEYLAGDKGYTFEAKKSFKNGAHFGIFFSRTNVSKNLFGEGSFDKGVMVSIPLPSIFSRETNMGKYIWRPLTKDPAATLVKSIDLMDELERYRFY